MTKNIFMIGNSLTWDTLPRNIDSNVKYHIATGKNLKFIFDNPDRITTSNAVDSTSWRILTEENFDYVVVQPFKGTTLAQDIEIISHWMSLQPNATFIIHTGWNQFALHDSNYFIEQSPENRLRSQDYFLQLLENLTLANPHRVIRTTRALEVLENINQETKRGISPFNELSNLYRDNIHMSDLIRSDNGAGRYLMHNIMRLALEQPTRNNPRLARGFLLDSPEIKTYLDNHVSSLGIEMVGSNNDDVMTGTSLSDVLIGGGGNDILRGRGGNNILSGGDGDDTLTANNGRNILYGGDGNDLLSALGGDDTMFGGTGNDTLFGRSGDDQLFGGSGDDVLNGGLGNDYLEGGEGNDILIGNGGNDTLVGGLGNDTLTGGAGRDVFRFNAFDEGINTMTDFSVVADIIEIKASGFDSNFALGTLSSERFTIAPSSLVHGFSYNPNNGNLFYHSDNIENQIIQIASLSTGLNLTHKNIFVI